MFRPRNEKYQRCGTISHQTLSTCERLGATSSCVVGIGEGGQYVGGTEGNACRGCADRMDSDRRETRHRQINMPKR